MDEDTISIGISIGLVLGSIIAVILTRLYNLDIIAVAALGIAIFSVWIQRVRGPEFVFHEARVVTHQTSRETEGLVHHIQINIMFHNIGDRFGHLRFNSIHLKLNDNRIITPKDPETDYQVAPDAEIVKGLNFRISEEIHLKESIFESVLILKGVYSNHKGKMPSFPRQELEVKPQIIIG